MMAYNNTTNLAAMFNGSANPTTTAPISSTAVCTACGTEIAPAVADFSRKHFGKYLCRDCQPKGGTGRGTPAGKCELCGADVDEKVKSFSERKFKRILCLACQKKASIAPTEAPKPVGAPAPQNKPEVHCDRCKTVLTPAELTQAENDRKGFNGHIVCPRCAEVIRANRAAKKAQGSGSATEAAPPKPEAAPTGNICEKCGASVSAGAAEEIRGRLKGHLYCPVCLNKLRAARAAKKVQEEAAARANAEKQAEASTPVKPSENVCEKCGAPVPTDAAEKIRSKLNGHLYCAKCINELRAQKTARKGAEPALKTAPPIGTSGSQLPREWSPAKQDTPRTKADMEKTAALNARLIKEAERQNGDALGRCSMSDLDVLLQEGGIHRPIEDSGLDIIVDNCFPWPDVLE